MQYVDSTRPVTFFVALLLVLTLVPFLPMQDLQRRRLLLGYDPFRHH